MQYFSSKIQVLILFCFFVNGFLALGFADEIPDDFKKVVTFIYIDKGSGTPTVNGTGFFVSISTAPTPERVWAI